MLTDGHFAGDEGVGYCTAVSNHEEELGPGEYPLEETHAQQVEGVLVTEHAQVGFVLQGAVLSQQHCHYVFTCHFVQQLHNTTRFNTNN